MKVPEYPNCRYLAVSHAVNTAETMFGDEPPWQGSVEGTKPSTASLHSHVHLLSRPLLWWACKEHWGLSGLAKSVVTHFHRMCTATASFCTGRILPPPLDARAVGSRQSSSAGRRTGVGTVSWHHLWDWTGRQTVLYSAKSCTKLFTVFCSKCQRPPQIIGHQESHSASMAPGYQQE